MAKIIIPQTEPTQFELNRVDLKPLWFDQVVWEKGYDIIHERAVQCPCKVQGTKGNLSTCKNCGGSGWVFINPTETRMMLQSMNLTTKHQEWSKENLGTVQITARSVDNLSFMDRITMVDSINIQSEVLYPNISATNKLFAFSIYSIKEVVEVFYFVGEDVKLQKLDSTQYTVDNNKVIFDDSFLEIENPVFSIRYWCNIQYHILDIVREVRNSYKKEDIEKQTVFPNSAVARRSHYVLDAETFTGQIYFDNSY